MLTGLSATAHDLKRLRADRSARIERVEAI
jgi:hypothetical protein